MIRFKHGVRVDSISPQALLAIVVAEGVWLKHKAFPDELVVTSVNDGAHRETSLHYRGDAVDLRIWNLPEDMRSKAAVDLEGRLPADYDVVLESDHIHVEYQPKRSNRAASDPS